MPMEVAHAVAAEVEEVLAVAPVVRTEQVQRQLPVGLRLGGELEHDHRLAQHRPAQAEQQTAPARGYALDVEAVLLARDLPERPQVRVPLQRLGELSLLLADRQPGDAGARSPPSGKAWALPSGSNGRQASTWRLGFGLTFSVARRVVLGLAAGPCASRPARGRRPRCPCPRCRSRRPRRSGWAGPGDRGWEHRGRRERRPRCGEPVEHDPLVARGTGCPRARKSAEMLARCLAGAARPWAGDRAGQSAPVPRAPTHAVVSIPCPPGLADRCGAG